jgi:triacylglycerol lipase
MTPSPRDYALIALEAYSAAPDIGVEKSASRAIIRDTPAGLVVAFPGSNNANCWQTDFNALPTTVDGIGSIHRGFWEAWLAIAAPVLEAIGDKPVTFVGHSLGAALAIVAATVMTKAQKPPAAVYGFEPPRVSPDINIRTILANEPVKLYRNGLDIVTDLPANWSQSAELIGIGTPWIPIPNAVDHMLPRVIKALPQ